MIPSLWQTSSPQPVDHPHDALHHPVPEVEGDQYDDCSKPEWTGRDVANPVTILVRQGRSRHPSASAC